MFSEFNGNYDLGYYAFAERYVYNLLNSFLGRYSEWLKYNYGLNEVSILKEYLGNVDIKYVNNDCLYLNGLYLADEKCNISFQGLDMSALSYGHSEYKASIVRTLSFKYDETIDYELICKINNYLRKRDHLPQISVDDLNTIEITEYFDCGWLIEKCWTYKEFNDAAGSFNLTDFEENVYKEYPLSEKEELLIAREICSLDVACIIINIISDESHKKTTVHEIMERFIEASI